MTETQKKTAKKYSEKKKTFHVSSSLTRGIESVLGFTLPETRFSVWMTFLACYSCNGAVQKSLSQYCIERSVWVIDWTYSMLGVWVKAGGKDQRKRTGSPPGS